jgi:predicted RNase H-like HicB family nuclease
MSCVRYAERVCGNTTLLVLCMPVILKSMKFRVILEFDSEAGSYSAVCPELPGCASYGDTEQEALRNIREAIQLYLEPGDIEVPEDARVLEVTVG